jgi:hypothetical protein
MGQGLAGLRFKPGLARSLGNTVEQLLAEAGLGRGQGRGQSSRQDNMDNIGLFGNLPGLSEPQSGDSARQGNRPGLPGSVREGGIRDWSRSPSSEAGSGRLPAGTADVAAPLPYRRRVAEYFQRLAEELGGK